MPDPSRNWTGPQLAGITTTGQSLLLSAAAGSGKTAVLAERCVYLVCEAPHACEIDEILVVAFNEAAAKEMKGRIQLGLQSYFVRNASERIEKQVALAERAAISTLHAFCLRLLKQHFHRVGLDPNFTVLDADEAALLRYDVAREIFEAHYESDNAEAFQALIDHYGDGDDERLISQVLRIQALLTSVINPQAWRERSINRLLHAGQVKIEESDIGQAFLKLVRDDLCLLSDKISAALQTCRIATYTTKLTEWQAIVGYWRTVFDEHGLDAFADEARSIDDELGKRMPAVKADVAGKELESKLVTDIKKHLQNGFCREAGTLTRGEWRESVAQILIAAQTLLDLVAESTEAYQLAKTQQRAVDFSDLERLALRVLSADEAAEGKAPSDVAKSYQKRFKHVLVDEYQDINEVQDAILRLVSREGAANHSVESNLFCVGDVKQSIYRFRLAEPRRFLDRYSAFKSGALPGRVIDLQENFRSRGPLLEAINAVFRRLMTQQSAEIDYDASHELRPGAPYPPATGQQFAGRPIELHVVPERLSQSAGDHDDGDGDEFEQDEYEASLAAKRINELTGRDGQSTPRQVMERDGDALLPRDIRLGDIVVLLRSAKITANRYADILRRSGIPAHADSRTGFFESQEIRDLMALLQLLDNQQQDIPLAAVLRGPIGRALADSHREQVAKGIAGSAGDLNSAEKTVATSAATFDPKRGTLSENDLAAIRLAYPELKPSLPFHEAVRRYSTEKSDRLAAALQSRLTGLRRWREAIHQRPVAEVIRAIYDDTGLLAYYAGLPGGDQRMANLEELYRRSMQFGTFAKQGLARFLRFLENLERDSDLGQPSLDPEGNDVVRIMTIHQSKGLEFPVVILPNLGRGFNRMDASGSILADRRAHLAMETIDEPRQIRYPSMATLVVSDTIAAQSTAEEIRILYVALTRAREHLILIGSTKPEAADSAIARWSNHAGPLPVQSIRDAGCFIDWLLPVAAVEGAGVISAETHSADEMKTLAATPDARSSNAGALAPFANLTPLPAADSPIAAGVLERLRHHYPHAVATTTPASRSVTSWTKRGPAANTSLEPERKEHTPDPTSSLDLPRFLAEDVVPKAVDLGSYTHLVLQHYGFAATAPPLEDQIGGMVTRALLTEAQAKLIDRGSIEWFLQSVLGQQIRTNAAKLKRELPVYLPVTESVELSEPADQVMLRGRLDAFLDLPGGGVVIDYKTDRVSGPRLDDRAAFYAGQLRAYLTAMTKITGRSVTEAYLVFLSPRKIVRV